MKKQHGPSSSRESSLGGQSWSSDRVSIPTSAPLREDSIALCDEQIPALGSVAEAVLYLAPQAMLVCDVEGKITFANAMAEQVIQTPLRETSLFVAPAVWGEMCDLRGRAVDVHDWPLMRALHGETILAAEYRLIRRDTRSFDLLCGAVPIRVPHSEKIIGALGTFTDLTHFNRRCLKLRTAGVLSERRRMAADIHDTLCQGLNAVVLQIQAGLNDFPARLDRAQHYLALAQQSARESLAEARCSMWTLAQTSDQIGDLTRVVPAMIARILTGTQTHFQCHIQPEARNISRFLRMQIYRILREAVRNVAKHAGASVVRIDISCDGDEVVLSVQDDGKGFAEDAITSRTFGLASMRERTHGAGGQIAIDSKPGHGTRLTVTIPLFPRVSSGI